MEHQKNIPSLLSTNIEECSFSNFLDSSALKEGYESDKLSDSDEEQDIRYMDPGSNIQIVKGNYNVDERGSAIGSVWTGNSELSLLGGDDFSFL